MSGLNVFFSYSHKDEELRDELEVHLALLKRQGILRAWHDRKITAGKEWKDDIDENLQRADVILLLVSPYFIASDYCWDVEVKRAMERHAAGEALVIPIILRPVDWGSAPFSRLQGLPKNAKPVTTWANRDEAFFDVAKGLRAAIEAGQQGRPASSAAPSPAAPSSAAPSPAGRSVVVSGDVVGGQITTGDHNVLAGGDVHVHIGSPSPSAGASRGGSSGDAGQDALSLWQEKLAYLLREEVIASDAEKKFTLKKKIEEAKAKIRELGG